ncbi:GlcNAc-transferase family protein [Micromonospora marina]|uniref:Glycosyltransferase, GT2 family n=1 Tax=Micromonospora marina TaxID=307120 RepID=A0A1C4ZDY8_9ACTN|nr:GlcNAc-transferase family protein [Micromonospora marina]SCF30921.1 Glycosyltransferase, GT2 family [Micromonospora marina]
MSIFVSVASYRDAELVPTVRDCLAKAARPDRVRIVVCWQHRGDEDVSAIAADPRVELLDVDARASRGACWARAQVMGHYAGEDWFLQVDSHTRFAPDWDARLLTLAAGTGAGKPVITGYPPRYEPADDLPGDGLPAETIVRGWTGDGLPVLGQRPMTDRSRPTVPARFVAGGFLFAPGSLVREVPYDPRIYFLGEELTMSVRAFTWGYDLFHPTEALAWHHYLREGSPRHWTDHTSTAGTPGWWTLDRASRRRVGVLLRRPNFGRYGLGRVRPLAEYLAHAGCDLTRRTWSDWRQPAAVGA